VRKGQAVTLDNIILLSRFLAQFIDETNITEPTFRFQFACLSLETNIDLLALPVGLNKVNYFEKEMSYE